MLALNLRVPILVFVLSLSHPAAADSPVIDLYEIEGNSLADLRLELAAKGPVGKDGVRHQGYTTWNVSWRFKTRSVGTTCEILDLSTSIESNISMPTWNPSPNVSAELVERWNAYRSALEAHEQGHHEFALNSADEIKRELGNLRGNVGCSQLVEQLNTQGREIIEKQVRLEREYDQRTRHGATQGAVL